jgi:hypothetical protein
MLKVMMVDQNAQYAQYNPPPSVLNHADSAVNQQPRTQPGRASVPKSRPISVAKKQAQDSPARQPSPQVQSANNPPRVSKPPSPALSQKSKSPGVYSPEFDGAASEAAESEAAASEGAPEEAASEDDDAAATEAAEGSEAEAASEEDQPQTKTTNKTSKTGAKSRR